MLLQASGYPVYVANKETRARRITAADVARRAGLSRSTVSAVLNGNTARFPDATVDAVFDAAQELKYTPSTAARTLVSGRSGTIVLLLPDTTFGTQIQDLADRLAEDLGAAVNNVVVRFATGNMSALYGALRALNPDAVVNFGGLSPKEHVDLSSEGFTVLPVIGVNDQTGQVGDRGVSRLQLLTIPDRANRRIAFAGLKERRNDVFGPQRYRELSAACSLDGIAAPERVLVDPAEGPWVDGLQELLERAAGEPLGVVCYNDDVALAVLAAARVLGVDVPSELSIVGMDGTVAGQLVSPRLTSIRMDLGKYADYLALVLAEALGTRLEATRAPSGNFFEALLGESTAPAEHL